MALQHLRPTRVRLMVQRAACGNHTTAACFAVQSIINSNACMSPICWFSACSRKRTTEFCNTSSPVNNVKFLHVGNFGQIPTSDKNNQKYLFKIKLTKQINEKCTISRHRTLQHNAMSFVLPFGTRACWGFQDSFVVTPSSNALKITWRCSDDTRPTYPSSTSPSDHRQPPHHLIDSASEPWHASDLDFCSLISEPHAAQRILLIWAATKL